MARSRKQPQKKRKTATPEPLKLASSCPCGEPADNRFTVTCATCECWWHGSCINFPETAGPFIKALHCNQCSRAYRVKTSWYAHCRLPGCKTPVTRDDSEYCTAEHAQTYWERAVKKLDDPRADLQILKWLMDRSQNAETFSTVAPDNIPREPKKLTDEQKEWKSKYDEALAARETNQTCGFVPALMGLAGDICSGPLSCPKHRNWPTAALRRWELSTLDEDVAALPDRKWLAKRATYLVAGTTRFSQRRRLRAAYFLPYVWEEDNDSYFLKDDPEPFWAKHF